MRESINKPQMTNNIVIRSSNQDTSHRKNLQSNPSSKNSSINKVFDMSMCSSLPPSRGISSYNFGFCFGKYNPDWH